MAIFVWRKYLLFFALLVQALGYPPPSLSSRATPVAAPQVKLPRETHIQRAVSTSQATSSTSESPGSASSATSAGIAKGPFMSSCITFFSMINSCNSLSPGFNSLPVTEQFSCLCETNTTVWVPTVFDDALTSCEQYLFSIGDYSQYRSVEGWGGLCVSSASIGTTPIITGTFTTGIPTTLATTTTVPTSTAPSPLPPTGISTFSTKEKVGIGLGGCISLSIAGYCIYLLFRFKKPHAVGEETEGREDVNSPQNDTMNAGTEKGSPKSPEVHEAVVNIVQRVTM